MTRTILLSVAVIIIASCELKIFWPEDAPADAQVLAFVKDWEYLSGKLKVQEDVIDGLENLPGALIGLLAGENRGKRMVRV